MAHLANPVEQPESFFVEELKVEDSCEGFPSVNAYINRDNIAVATLKVFANTIEFISNHENKHEDNISVNQLKSDEVPF